MEKIPTLFMRNMDTDFLVRNEITPGCEWVIEGEGVATQKFDGTCVLVRKPQIFKRYEVKKGRSAPDLFVPAGDPDPNTGKQPGWVPVSAGKPDDKWHREAWENWTGIPPDGTYELVGPKIQGNAEGYSRHMLVRHGEFKLGENPRDFEGLRDYFQRAYIEGVVWHHEDGRMVKIKCRDFGCKRRR